jgi:hypothetical protein
MPLTDLPSWTPSVQQVALYILARTRVPNGELAGTFNSQTFPTDSQVTAIIQQQVRLLAPRMGDIPDSLADSASELLALKSAISVERSYFLEQVDNSPSHEELCKDFAIAMTNWEDAAQGDVPNGWTFGAMPIGTMYPGYATGTY